MNLGVGLNPDSRATTAGLRNVHLYAHQHLWRKGVLGTQDVYSHLTGAWTEPSIIGSPDRSVPLWVVPLSHRFGVGSPKSALHIDLVNQVVSSPQRSYGFRLFTDDMEMQNAWTSTCGGLFVVSSSLFFTHCFQPSPWFRWHTVCIQIFAN